MRPVLNTLAHWHTRHGGKSHAAATRCCEYSQLGEEDVAKEKKTGPTCALQRLRESSSDAAARSGSRRRQCVYPAMVHMLPQQVAEAQSMSHGPSPPEAPRTSQKNLRRSSASDPQFPGGASAASACVRHQPIHQPALLRIWTARQCSGAGGRAGRKQSPDRALPARLATSSAAARAGWHSAPPASQQHDGSKAWQPKLAEWCNAVPQRIIGSRQGRICACTTNQQLSLRSQQSVRMQARQTHLRKGRLACPAQRTEASPDRAFNGLLNSRGIG